MESQSLVVQLQGEAPYGFRLIGGENSPLIVSKIRPYSKCQQGGLLEGDVVLAINGVSTRGLTHATATGLTECNARNLSLHILRGKNSQHDYQTALGLLNGQIRTLSDSEASQIISAAPIRSTPSSSGGDVAYERINSLVINGDADTPFQLQMPPSGGLKQMRNFRRESMEHGNLPVIRVSDAGNDVDDVHQVVASTVANQVPGFYSREEHSFDEGDTQRRTVQEVSTEKHGGTTVTKVVKQEFSNRQTAVQIPVQFGSRQPTTFAVQSSAPGQQYNSDPDQRQQYQGYHPSSAAAPIKVQWDTEPQPAQSGQMLHGVSVNASYNNSEVPVRVQTYNQQTNSWESSGHQVTQPQRVNASTSWQTEVVPKIMQDLNDSTAWNKTAYHEDRSTDQWNAPQNTGRSTNDWHNAEKDVKVDVRPGGEIQIQFQPNINQYNPPQSYIDVQGSYQSPQQHHQNTAYTMNSNEYKNNDSGNSYNSGMVQYPYRGQSNSNTTQYFGGTDGMPIISAECSSGELPNISFSVQPPSRSMQSYTITREEPLVTYYQTTSQQVQPKAQEHDMSRYRPFETDITETRQTKRIIETTNNVIEHPPVTVRTGFTVSTVGSQSPKTSVNNWGGASIGQSRVQQATPPAVESRYNPEFGQTNDDYTPVEVQQKLSALQSIPIRSNPAPAATGQYPWGTKDQPNNSRQNNPSSLNSATPPATQQMPGTGSRILRPFNSQDGESRNGGNAVGNSAGYQKQNSNVLPNSPPWVQSTAQDNNQYTGNYTVEEPAEYQSQNYTAAGGKGALSGGFNDSYQQGYCPKSPPVQTASQYNTYTQPENL